MRPTLTSLTIRGFKTIRELKDFDPGRLTVLIGPNGAGKSNLLSFFRMLSRMMTPPGDIQTYVAEQGGASSLLYDGPAGEIEAALIIQHPASFDEYIFQLCPNADDTVRADIKLRTYSGQQAGAGSTPVGLPISEVAGPDEVSRRTTVKSRRWIVHQFNNTSDTSQMRSECSIDEGFRLKEDAGNLAAFLYRLQQTKPRHYLRIVETIRMIHPFFTDFEFRPESGRLLLRWHERDTEVVFGSWQAADGMLRIMALVALLRQPEEDLPDVLILDEPELGLHPYAIAILVAMLQSVSHHVQVIIATQSVSLVDRFEPHDIVVVDRVGRESRFRRLNDADLDEWREDYTMSELWEKNVLGGRPGR